VYLLGRNPNRNESVTDDATMTNLQNQA